MDIILNYIGEIILAFGAPATLIVFIILMSLYIKRNEGRLKYGTERFEETERTLKIIGQSALRLEIIHDAFPVEERIHAYHRYVNLFGGNGFMKTYYETVLLPEAEEKARKIRDNQ